MCFPNMIRIMLFQDFAGWHLAAGLIVDGASTHSSPSLALLQSVGRESKQTKDLCSVNKTPSITV